MPEAATRNRGRQPAPTVAADCNRAAGGSPRAEPPRRCGAKRLIPIPTGIVPLQPAGFRLRLCFL